MDTIQKTDFYELKPGDVIRNRHGEYAVVIGHDAHFSTFLHFHPAEIGICGFTYDNELYTMIINMYVAEEWHKVGTVGEYI